MKAGIQDGCRPLAVNFMVPIGIITQNRAAYLDVTLRSLSATQLPADVPLTVFDDSSVDDLTLSYYGTTKPLSLAHNWPDSAQWRAHGLDIISKPASPSGIHGRVEVYRLADRPLGVVSGSCLAIQHLFERFPKSQGVILLQDDEVFNADWYQRMLDTVGKSNQFTHLPLGILAGLKLNHKLPVTGTPPLAFESGITAQCLYVSCAAYDRRRSYFTRKHQQQKRFDDMLRREIAGAELWAGCIYPFVCQHFGVQSLVRPEKKWTALQSGRIGYYARPPFVLADTVRQFKGCFQ